MLGRDPHRFAQHARVGAFAVDQPLPHPLVHQRLDRLAVELDVEPFGHPPDLGAKRALPWIIGIRSTVSSKYSTIGCDPMRVTAWSGSTITGVSPGRVQVDELVALLPRVFAHQLMADAFLGQDQPDLARKGAERELEELPHGAAALARGGDASSASDRSDRAYSPWRARSTRCASSSALHDRGQSLVQRLHAPLRSSARPRRSAAADCGRNWDRRAAPSRGP